MDVALFLLSRYFWFALGVGLVWMLRDSVSGAHVRDTTATAFASAPSPTTPTFSYPPPEEQPSPTPSPTVYVDRDPPTYDGPRALREIRPGCPRDVVRERAAHHTRVRVPRELVDWLLESQTGAAMRSVTVVPERRFGSVVGVRLLRAPSGGYLHRLGFEVGDVLETVNGYDVATPERALEAYARLRSSSDYVVVVERHGIPHVLYFTIC